MPTPTDRHAEKHYTEVNSQHLKTAAFEPAHFYELTVQWPMGNRMTYVAGSEIGYGHLRAVAAKAEEHQAEASLRIYSESTLKNKGVTGMDSDVADAILWREGKVRVRALEQFRKHAHAAIRHEVDVLCGVNLIKEAAELLNPYSVYRVQASDHAEEYAHKNVLAIDFDGVIASIPEDALDHLGQPLPGAIEALHTLEQMGYKIGIMSAHCRTVEGEEEVRKWLDHYGAPFVVTTSTKIPAALYIDDKALKFTDWESALEEIPKLAPIQFKGPYQSPASDEPYQSNPSDEAKEKTKKKNQEASLCEKDASYLEWNERECGWACPACNKKTAFLERVAATVYALTPGDKVHVRSVEGSTLGDAYLLYKADGYEERALKAANLWLTYFPGGNYLPVAEELLTKIGHDDEIRKAALKIIDGKNVQITAREDIPLRYDIDHIIEATLTEANQSRIPLDSVLVGMAAKHQLTPEDLDVVTEAVLSLSEPVKADLSANDERLINATRDALEESDAFFADAEQVPDEDEETQMVLGYLADEFNWSDELTDNEIVSTTKEVIANLREAQAMMPRWVRGENKKNWRKAAHEFGDKGHCATISAFRAEYKKEKRSTAEETDRIDSETQDYTPTNQPSLTSVPESDYDVVRQQTEADSKEEGFRRYGPGKFSTILDSLIYAISDDGFIDDECGEAQYTGWYGSMYMPSVEDLNAEAKSQGVEPLTEEEIEYVNENPGGVIIWEGNSGFVEIEAYASEEERKKEWDRISTEVNKEMDDAEGSEASLMPEEPYRGTDIDNVQASDEDRWTKFIYECPSCETQFTESKKPERACPICRAPADKLKSIAGWPPLEFNPKNQKDTKRLQDEDKKYRESPEKKEFDKAKEEMEKSKQAILNKSIADLKLTEAQLKVVAGVRETIDQYTDDFLSRMGQFFTYDWDPGASWEVKEVKGKKMIVRKDPPKKAARATRHAYVEGQVLKMYDGVMPVDVKVIALLGEDRYKIKSSINNQELECDELDLFTIDTETQLFN